MSRFSRCHIWIIRLVRDAVQDESRTPGKVIQLAFIPRFAGLKNPVYTSIFVTHCNISNNAVSDQ